MALNGYGYGNEPPATPHHLYPMSVSDIVKLATAGVKIDFKDIAGQVQRDDQFAPNTYQERPVTLEEAFWQRWQRANVVDAFTMNGVMRPYIIHCHQHGEHVHVMVCPPKEEPFIYKDTRVLYPSDTLMASLALYEQVKP